MKIQIDAIQARQISDSNQRFQEKLDQCLQAILSSAEDGYTTTTVTFSSNPNPVIKRLEELGFETSKRYRPARYGDNPTYEVGIHW